MSRYEPRQKNLKMLLVQGGTCFGVKQGRLKTEVSAVHRRQSCTSEVGARFMSLSTARDEWQHRREVDLTTVAPTPLEIPKKTR